MKEKCWHDLCLFNALEVKVRKIFKILTFVILSAFLFSCSSLKETARRSFKRGYKILAITVDDLPFAVKNKYVSIKARREAFNKFLEVLEQNNISVAGFLIGSHYSKDWLPYLKRWVEQNNILGNHTYSHLDYNKVSSKEYLNDISECDKVLEKIIDSVKSDLNIPFTQNELTPAELGDKRVYYPNFLLRDSSRVRNILTASKQSFEKVFSGKYALNYKYFRFPYLDRGDTPEKKYAVLDFLDKNGYTVAPVTITSNDWKFNPRFEVAYLNHDDAEMERISNEYIKRIELETFNSENYALQTFHREVAQILLFHLNLLNAYSLQKIIDWYRENGWTIVDLPTALKDDLYEMEDGYNGSYGVPWLFRAKRLRRTSSNPFAFGN